VIRKLLEKNDDLGDSFLLIIISTCEEILGSGGISMDSYFLQKVGKWLNNIYEQQKVTKAAHVIIFLHSGVDTHENIHTYYESR